MIIPIDRKSGSAGMPRPISYAVVCLKHKRQLGMVSTADYVAHGKLGVARYVSAPCTPGAHVLACDLFPRAAATPRGFTLSLHDALPIFGSKNHTTNITKIVTQSIGIIIKRL